jgi:GTP-binding protein Era
VNKVDLVEPKTRLKAIADTIDERLGDDYESLFYISALTGDGFSQVQSFLFDAAQPRDWEFSSDTFSVMSPLEQVRERVREKIFQRVNQEVPYGLQQVGGASALVTFICVLYTLRTHIS